jgi:endonuclease III
MKLFQETWCRRPFWMLVGCILVNRATWAKAEAVHAELRKRWPNEVRLAKASFEEVRDAVRPLGLQDIRAKNLLNLATHWVVCGRPRTDDRDFLKSLPGCGDYAADSWKIFVSGTMTKPRVGMDKKLRTYLEERR